jgi:hypothetical protein
MDDKKNYKAMLKSLGATTSYPTMLTKLSDIGIMTDDATLRGHAERISAALRGLLGPAVQPGNLKNSLVVLGRTWHASQLQNQRTVSEAVVAAHHYCQQCLASTEPQWAILARNAGWTPPPLAVQ